MERERGQGLAHNAIDRPTSALALNCDGLHSDMTLVQVDPFLFTITLKSDQLHMNDSASTQTHPSRMDTHPQLLLVCLITDIEHQVSGVASAFSLVVDCSILWLS